MLDASKLSLLTLELEVYSLSFLFLVINIYICFQQYFSLKKTIKKKNDEQLHTIHEKDLLQLLLHISGTKFDDKYTSASPYFLPIGNLRQNINSIHDKLCNNDKEHVQNWINSSSTLSPVLMEFNMLADIGKELFLSELKQLILFYGKYSSDSCETILDAIHMLESQKNIPLSSTVAQQLLVRLNQTGKPLSFSRESCCYLCQTFQLMFQENLLSLAVFRHLQFGLYFLQQNVEIDEIEIL